MGPTRSRDLSGRYVDVAGRVDVALDRGLGRFVWSGLALAVVRLALPALAGDAQRPYHLRRGADRLDGSHQPCRRRAVALAMAARVRALRTCRQTTTETDQATR